MNMLYAILGKEVKWTWSDKEHQAFEVTHYGLIIGHLNSDLPVLLLCDASSYGIGIVLPWHTAYQTVRKTNWVCFSIIIES